MASDSKDDLPTFPIFFFFFDAALTLWDALSSWKLKTTPHPHPLAQNYPAPNVVMGSGCLGCPALLSDVKAAFWVVMGTRSGDAS